ncbi:MAG: SDR family oxidoreductase, partial [Myxococcota bacterium]
PEADVARFEEAYMAYVERHTDGSQTSLDPAPRWAIWPGHGVVSFGRTIREAQIVADIVRHTWTCIQRAEALGGWRALGAEALFEMEYWELEQAKLKRGKQRPPWSGRIALVTGAASGIGRATAHHLASLGAAVVAVDIDPKVNEVHAEHPGVVAQVADLTSSEAVSSIIAEAVVQFGGLDALVSCAGTFPPSARLEALDDALWERTLAVNVTSHHKVLRAATPYLARGTDPAVVIVASKNVPAPGPGMGAYSAAKAALTQLGRVAALELGRGGIRVNVVHPNAVFDTGIWDESTIAARAKHYGLTPEGYRTRNVLGVEIRSEDVATLIETLLGPSFRCTTGAQVPIDGGNERVI